MELKPNTDFSLSNTDSTMAGNSHSYFYNLNTIQKLQLKQFSFNNSNSKLYDSVQSDSVQSGLVQSNLAQSDLAQSDLAQSDLAQFGPTRQIISAGIKPVTRNISVPNIIDSQLGPSAEDPLHITDYSGNQKLSDKYIIYKSNKSNDQALSLKNSAKQISVLPNQDLSKLSQNFIKKIPQSW